MNELMTCREVQDMLGIGKTKIYQLIGQEPPAFPLPIRLSPRHVRWKRSELMAWVENQPRGIARG